MSSSLRRWVPAALAVALFGYIVIGLASGGGPGSDRVDSIADGLRCPVCQSESVADSTSQTARDMRTLIEDQIAAGRSDSEIEAFFVARYGEWILLDPPARGRTLLLWLLPAGAVAAGLVIILGRRRARRSPMHLAPEAAAERRRHALQDSDEVARQAAEGELDAATFARLRATYEAEAAEAASEETPAPGRSTRRVAAGLALFAAAIGVVSFAVVRAVEPRAAGGFVTGAAEAPEELELDSVSIRELEAVVAANPDVVPMRLALARRYFNAGDFSAALTHYLVVLERESNPEALANVGWMAYLSNEPETASGYLEKSLEVAPDFTQAKLFLANVRLYGLDDAGGATQLINEVLAAEALPDEIRAEAERMLAEASPDS